MNKALYFSGFLLAIGAAAAVPASAADMYRPEAGGYKDDPYIPVAAWTGFYVGVNGGYGWSANSDQFSMNAFRGLSPQGGFGGGQIGYNWQRGMSPLVLGIEADIQGDGIGSNWTGFDAQFKSRLDYFGTVRGRIGYGFGRTLFYATGGFAYGGLNSSFCDCGDHEIWKFKDTATGYVLGGGLEYKFNPSWSVKVEYQYLNFGKNDLTIHNGPPLSTFAKLDDDAFHTVRAGLSYHFHPAYEPLK